MTIDCVIVGFDDCATSSAALRWTFGLAAEDPNPLIAGCEPAPHT